eukprot:TRINITY_DN906_c0_g3_i1.p2 TRINITY_DN906_c0_g3~~TRINITY_DN906_c0_g3_i1.p2  ORF type:complete len:469 (+),score=133.95 TRINITY_DN906_c0_g3_i1:101-1507(+)
MSDQDAPTPTDPSAALLQEPTSQDEAPPAAVAAPPAAAAAAPTRAQVSQDPQAKAKRHQNATAFLRNPKVRTSTLTRRVNFLKSKGLSQQEILEAFRAVGDPQEPKKIEDIINNVTIPEPSSSSAPAPAAPPPPAAAPVHRQPAPPQYYQPPPQHYSVPPPPPPRPERDWKDLFIGATVAGAAVWGLKTIVGQFVDVEVRRKGDARVSRRRRAANVAGSDLDDFSRPTFPPPAPARNAGANREELQKLERSVETKVEEVKTAIGTIEQQLKDCSFDKLEELRQRCSDLLRQSAAEKGNLEKRLAKLHHIDRLQPMQVRLGTAEDTIRSLETSVAQLRVAVEEATKAAKGGDDGRAATTASQPAGSPRAASPTAAAPPTGTQQPAPPPPGTPETPAPTGTQQSAATPATPATPIGMQQAPAGMPAGMPTSDAAATESQQPVADTAGQADAGAAGAAEPGANTTQPADQQ